MIGTIAIPLKQIDVLPQDRQHFDEQAIRELADSIAESGLAQPITLRPAGGRYTIVAGERRYRACLLLCTGTIDAHVRELSDEEASTIQLLENIARQSLDPIEEAHAYRKRIDKYGWTVEELARRVGASPTTVRVRLELLDLIPEMQFLVSSGQMVFTYARAVRSLDPNRQHLAMRAYLDHPEVDRSTWHALVERLRTEMNAELEVSMFDSGTLELIAAEYVVDAKQRRKPGVQTLLDVIGDLAGHVTDPAALARARAALAAYGRA